MGADVDIVYDDGTHTYWSTWCRHDNHAACAATELAPNLPRKPAQCKTCAAPCICDCHNITLEWLVAEARVLLGSAPVPKGDWGRRAMDWLDAHDRHEEK